MKQIITITLFTFYASLYSQVGINTDAPNSGTGLDVNGKTNVTDRIYLGDENLNQTGSPGNNNQLIVSGGSTDSPKWDTKKLPNGYGETFTMTYMNSGFDTTGADLGANGSIPYTEGMTLNNTTVDTGTPCPQGDCWKVLDNLTHTFPIYKNSNKINFTFQTTVQAKAAGTLSYGCGIFLKDPSAADTNANYKLVGVRMDALYQVAIGDYKLFNMNVTLQNLQGSPNGNQYKVKVACRGRATGNQLVVGKPRTPTDASLNSDMARSALNIFVLESWE